MKSSNVGAIKIGLGVGAERLGRYVRRFGFGERLSGDLPGETRGMLSDPKRWSQSTLASVSMGYEIGVTPLQMAAAVSSVANGGVLVQPRLVRALRHGATRTDVAPRELRRAISRETAAELVAIMEQVVADGTAKSAQVPGYTVAGKTGTASKIVNERYSQTDYHASFVGFVPSREPAFTILVVIDTPRAGSHYGGVGGGADLPAYRGGGPPPHGRRADDQPASARAAEGLGRRRPAVRRRPRELHRGPRPDQRRGRVRPPCPTSAAWARVKPRAGSPASVSCPG